VIDVQSIAGITATNALIKVDQAAGIEPASAPFQRRAVMPATHT